MVNRTSFILLSAALLVKAGSSGQDITWVKPSAGSTFGPGDEIVGEWTASKAPGALSVSLCSSSSGSCGGTVKPQVTQYGASYQISVAVPEISSESGYYLKMTDGGGNEMQSPGFSLDPAGKSGQPASVSRSNDAVQPSGSGKSGSGSSGSGSNPDSGHADDAQAPMSAKGSSGSGSSPAGSVSPNSGSGEEGSASNAPLSESAKKPSASGLVSPSPATSANDSTESTIPETDSGKTVGNDTDVRAPATLSTAGSGIPKAAIAVPLAFVGAALVAALGLLVARKRTAADERLRNDRLLALHSGPTDSYLPSRAPSMRSRASVTSPIDRDIERAVHALNESNGRERTRNDDEKGREHADVVYVPVPAPHTHPVPREDVRRIRIPSILMRAGSVFSGRSSSRFGNRRRNVDWDDQADYDAWDPYTYMQRRDSRRERPVFRKTPMPSYRSSRRPSLANTNIDYDNDDDNDGGSATDAILNDYISGPSRANSASSRSSRIPVHVHGTSRSMPNFPRAPPRSHSRSTAPEMQRRSQSYTYEHPESRSRFGYRDRRRASRHDGEDGGDDNFLSPAQRSHRTL